MPTKPDTSSAPCEQEEKLDPEVTVSEPCKKDQCGSDVPDGGWSWVVCFACFMTLVHAFGISQSFGIVFVELLYYFKTNKGETAWIASLNTGICFITGPILAPFVNRYGCRPVAVVGALLESCGLIISIFAHNIYFLYFSLGVLTGLGQGMLYLSSYVCLSQYMYFEKRRALGTGLGLCGSGIGTFIFGRITHMLIRTYAWQGALLILGGLLLHCVPCALVYRRIRLTPTAQVTEVMLEDTDEKLTSSDTDLGEDADTRLTIKDDITSDRTTAPTYPLTESAVNEIIPLYNLNQFEGADDSKLSSTEKICDRKCHDGIYERWLNSAINTRNSLTDGAVKQSKCFLNGSRRDSDRLFSATCAIFRKSFNFNIFRNVTFCVFAIAVFIYCIGYYTPYVYLPDKAHEAGLERNKVAWLISTIGITNTAGRVVSGYISDKKWVDGVVLYGTFLVIGGAATILVAFMRSYWLMLTYSFLYGLSGGAVASQTVLVVADFVGIRSFSEALSICNFAGALSTLVGLPFVGWLFDITQSYHATFITSGVCMAAGGVMLYGVPCLQRWINERKS